MNRAARGFTLIELMTVMAIISVLAAVALPEYRVAIIHAREAVLQEDLFQLRDLIDQYQADKGAYPESLQTLVDDGYLRQIPQDPITGTADWDVVYQEPDPDNPAEVPGVYDVKSTSTQVGLNGQPYNEW